MEKFTHELITTDANGKHFSIKKNPDGSVYAEVGIDEHNEIWFDKILQGLSLSTLVKVASYVKDNIPAESFVIPHDETLYKDINL